MGSSVSSGQPVKVFSSGETGEFSAEVKKGEKKHYTFQFKRGNYHLKALIPTTFNPTRSLNGVIKFTTNGKPTETRREISFAIRASKFLGNSWKFNLRVADVEDPLTITVELTSHGPVAATATLEVLFRVEPLPTGAVYAQHFVAAIEPPQQTPAQIEHQTRLTDCETPDAELSEDQKKKITELFHKADTDNNGSLDLDEFYKVLKFLFPTLTRPEFQSIITKSDKDGSQTIDLEEFLEAAAYYHWDMNTITQYPKPKPSEAAEKFEWEIPHSQLLLSTKLGEGAFGVVYKAKWRGIAVAVKELKGEGLSSEATLNEFRKEIGIMGKLRHPNVVLFIGACTEPPHLCMVTEFLSGGSLFDIIHKHKRMLDLLTATKMAWQTALGLNYLHLSTPQILHRDLKSMNLLVDEHLNVKICDFGLSCIKQEKDVLSEAVGSPFWMAPEVLQGQSYGAKADVYSFGVCYYELVVGKVPLSDQVDNSKPDSLKFVLGAVCQGHRASLPDHITNKEVRSIITDSWDQNPAKRPTFDQLSTRLEDLYNELEKEPKMQPPGMMSTSNHQQQIFPQSYPMGNPYMQSPYQQHYGYQPQSPHQIYQQPPPYGYPPQNPYNPYQNPYNTPPQNNLRDSFN